MIYNDIHDLAQYLNICRSQSTIIATSGGFDPMHIGHLRCLQESKRISIPSGAYKPNTILIAIVNSDGFLTRKKGKPFMPHAERMEIVDGVRGVDFVCGWDDGSQTVIGALEILKPDFFTKGGDRSEPDKVPEFDICQKIGCQIIFGVGGGKIQSSSDLIKNSRS